MARIPIARDVAELVGDFAEGVENRSLLLEKFMFHKDWGLDGLRSNDAHRWSIMRITDGGTDLLLSEAAQLQQRARGRNVELHNRTRLDAEADLATRLSKSRLEVEETRKLRVLQARNFVAQFRQSLGNACRVVTGKLEARMAVNLADGLIQNAGIALDRLFGTPYIPGSAVKGVSCHAALAGGLDPKVFEKIFGVQEQKGAISFLAAFPITDARIAVDLTNVHFPDYYRSGQLADLRNEKPLPNPFPVIEPGTVFAFCLALNGIDNDPELLATAARCVEQAITVHGLGAKTASGYGWFSIDPTVLEKIDEETRQQKMKFEIARRKAAELAEEQKREEARQAALTPEERAAETIAALANEQFAQMATALGDKTAVEQKGLLIALNSPARKETWKQWKKSDKPANKTRVELLRKLAAEHGVQLP